MSAAPIVVLDRSSMACHQNVCAKTAGCWPFWEDGASVNHFVSIDARVSDSGGLV
jgi:hypothetical protein